MKGYYIAILIAVIVIGIYSFLLYFHIKRNRVLSYEILHQDDLADPLSPVPILSSSSSSGLYDSPVTKVVPPTDAFSSMEQTKDLTQSTLNGLRF